MTHDPLCDCDDPTHNEYECSACVCDVIAATRSDEREQAAQRVASVPLLGNMGDPWYSNAVSLADAIVAARGDNQ